MTLGELNSILDDWCKVKIIQNNGEGKEYELTTKTKVEYFNDHAEDLITFITQKKNKIIIFTD